MSRDRPIIPLQFSTHVATLFITEEGDNMIDNGVPRDWSYWPNVRYSNRDLVARIGRTILDWVVLKSSIVWCWHDALISSLSFDDQQSIEFHYIDFRAREKQPL